MHRSLKLFNIIMAYVIILLLIGSVITLVLLLDNLKETLERTTKNRIELMLSETDDKLENFFSPIERRLNLIKSHVETGMFEELEVASLNKYFVPIIQNAEIISSAIIANELGDELLFLDKDSIWYCRQTKASGKIERPIVSLWQQAPDKKLKKTSEFKLSEHYDPSVRPWFNLGMSLPDGEIGWTTPYQFYTSEDMGITTVIKGTNTYTGLKYLIAFDLNLVKISEFTSTLSMTENSLEFIVDRNNVLVGLPPLPQFMEKDSLKKYLLKTPESLNVPIIQETLKHLNSRENDGKYFTFEFNNQEWWCGRTSFSLGSKENLSIIAIAPKSDFTGEFRRTKWLILGGFSVILIVIFVMATSYFLKQRANDIITAEKEKNEQLLLNTLPPKVVRDLQEKGYSPPQKFDNVTVMFADIVDFTPKATKMSPEQLIAELNDIYSGFDNITGDNGCQRIKTIGDAYLAVSGIPEYNEENALNIVKAAIGFIRFLSHRNLTARHKWEIRIGIHTGTVIGGVVGVRKYLYDIFGDTLNTASRMEANSEPMKITLSETTFDMIRHMQHHIDDSVKFVPRKPVQVKGKGQLQMYFAEVNGDHELTTS